MSRSRSPELVTRDDIMEFDLGCNPITSAGARCMANGPSMAQSSKPGLMWARSFTITLTKYSLFSSYRCGR